MSAHVHRIGLTGGIGSGKSTVAQMLVERGATLIDADAISRQLTAPGGLAIAAIKAHFGGQMITAEGALDRARMRTLAFNDVSARRALEAIIHPQVKDEILAQTGRATAQGNRCLVFDIPLLVESGRWRQEVDRVLVVDCRESTQIERVMARDCMAREAAEKIMAGQATRSQRLAAADAVIYNDELSLEALGNLVIQLSKRFGL